MRLLVDEDVDVRIIGVLRRLGHNVRRVPSGTQNGAVIRLAKREERVLVTRDADFADTSVYPPARSAGIIRLAIHPPSLQNLAPPLTDLLTAIPEHEFTGALFVVEATGHRRVP